MLAVFKFAAGKTIVSLQSFRLLVDYGLSFLGIFVTTFMLLIYLQNMRAARVDPPALRKLPRLSVIIPAHNEEDTIKQTADSVLRSSYPKNKLEVILVDDGSTDKTLEFMRACASRHRRTVKVISKKRGGKGSALNAGLAKARGELVATLDADSYVQPAALRQLTGFFRDGAVAAVTSVLKVARPQNLLQEMQRIEYLVTVFSRRLLSYINSVNVTPGPLSMFRAEVFKRVGGYDENNILEDQEIAMRIQANDYRIESSSKAVVYTNTPSSFRALMRQRVRWHRGGVRNILKHYYLMGRRYGDFGLVIVPLSVFSVIATFLVLFLALSAVASGSSALSSLFSYGWSALWIGVSPTHVLGALILVASLAWVYLGVAFHERERVTAPLLLAYTFVYAPIISVFWIATAIKELKGEKLSW